MLFSPLLVVLVHVRRANLAIYVFVSYIDHEHLLFVILEQVYLRVLILRCQQSADLDRIYIFNHST